MSTTQHTASERITAEVLSWPGTSTGTGTRGELSLRYGGREIGHLHGDRLAHFFFPPDLWRELQRAHRITPHPVFPGREGPAARAIAGEDDVRDVIAMLRLNYDAATRRRKALDAVRAAAAAGHRRYVPRV